ncbi:MAG: sigma-70 family RNA polymerase sigma factor [Candidatus Aminicenantes bacterium]|nr:sigma-70 family RNA polymerase sigma factor [Candidatus Aminicenantes bacterium]
MSALFMGNRPLVGERFRRHGHRLVMNAISEKFFLFIKSSFAPRQKTELFEYICKHYQRRIAFYVSQIIPRDHDYYQDVCQEVMLKVYNHLDTFNPLHSFKAWLFQIARHQCLDLVKNKEEKRRKLRQGDPDLIGSGAGADPEQRLLRLELRERIDQVIGALPPLDREICYLRFYENLKYREIGAIIGLDVDAVKAKIHSLKVDLRRQLNR